ncbi:leucine-rich repeat protein kinase family protein [Striga asiatica]|uniref:non-specific serine/threonine protein kinase n=1 Tax=Striga asiatica TaxID=4170 RepID=A0A5A7QSP4_STRAF|nr:leucine-rich repeat protein kinase family protein [Striga asiatica]
MDSLVRKAKLEQRLRPLENCSILFCFMISDMGFAINFLLTVFCLIVPPIYSQVTEFISIDCGGTNNHTDISTGLPWVSDSGIQGHGKAVSLGNNTSGKPQQYQTRRDFPTDAGKYCYRLPTEERRRYIVRATFLYGGSATGGAYPKFQLYLDATRWSTVTVMEASRVYSKEMIVRAPSASIDVCLCCASTGSPFISTLEMRPLNLSMYATDFEDRFYLKVAERVNFGAPTPEAIRYPDDPYDRIWGSDLDRRPNFLVGVAPGTVRVNTSRIVNVNTREYPPAKVMQTAVVGREGSLTYRLNLEDFPACARGYAYFAEIEDLGENETRKFKMVQPYMPDYSNAVVNVAENANGSYTLYEPSYMNVTLDFVLSFAFVKTPDSTRGPILNAMEISRYVEIAAKTYDKDVMALNALRSMHSLESEWTEEGGDPHLTGKNLNGEIPQELQYMDALTELWLDGNLLNGPIPDISGLVNLKILHLENNQLTGPLPSYLGNLPYLLEVYVQNNSLSSEIPSSLLRGNLSFRYEGNPRLRRVTKTHTTKLILGASIGFLALLILSTIIIIVLRRSKAKTTSQRNSKENSWRFSTQPLTAYSVARGGSLMEEGVSYYIPLADLEEATNNFSKQIGKGSFGPVYYGKMKDGKEVAVKTMADSSSHGTKQFVTELDWLARLRIAEDAAKGLEYLHTGCNPSIIHRDVKTSNILLDINMRAKVSDFGLSRQAEEDLTHVSSVARGTVGYLDPEYYANQQLTEKSDVYSVGIVLLELISGRKPVSTEEYGSDWSIVHWARSLIRKGDVLSIIDPPLLGTLKVESVWRIAEVAIQCVDQHSLSRPRMQEIILAIQDAANIEKGKDKLASSKAQSSRKTLLTSFLDIQNSTRGPKLNAMEISRYVEIAAKTHDKDVMALNALRSMRSSQSEWTEEGGDPCSPTTWNWVVCSSTTPPRITKMQNLNGEIPQELQYMDALTELWLDGNLLYGPIPDISGLVNLKILHLENNQLTGPLPSYLGNLPYLLEVYVQNNSLSSEIPSSLLRGNLSFRRVTKTHTAKLILGASIGFLALLILSTIIILVLRRSKAKTTSQRNSKENSWRFSTQPLTAYSAARGGSLMEEGVSYYIPLADLEEATNNFSKQIGKGSFGPVYYGKMKDGKEVAVKTMADSSSHGTKQFVTEKQLDWLARLRIAEDAAKGLEYLHTGCNPSIIHRDVKTSNILLDINMRAKVSDFGLSRQAEENLTHVSSVARGTVGYLDPESLIRKGDVLSIIDPPLLGTLKVESVWRIAEVAIQCVDQHSISRPRMQEIILAIQDAANIEKGKDKLASSKAQSSRKTLLTSFLDIQSPDLSNGSLFPSAR